MYGSIISGIFSFFKMLSAFNGGISIRKQQQGAKMTLRALFRFDSFSYW